MLGKCEDKHQRLEWIRIEAAILSHVCAPYSPHSRLILKRRRKRRQDEQSDACSTIVGLSMSWLPLERSEAPTAMLLELFDNVNVISIAYIYM